MLISFCTPPCPEQAKVKIGENKQNKSNLYFWVWNFFIKHKIKFINLIVETVSEFNEFEPRLKSAQNRFQSSAGLNLEKLNTILSGTNLIWPAA